MPLGGLSGAISRPLRPLLAALLSVFLLCSHASPARAHAVLLGTNPVDGAVLASAPEALTLTFNEPVAPLSFVLLASDGSVAEPGAAVRGGVELSVPLPEGPIRGTHVLSWRVVSDDGHPVGGALVFSVGTVTGSGDIGGTDPMLVGALWIGRVALQGGLLFGAGGALFVALSGLTTAARIPRRAAQIGLLGAFLSLGLQGVDALGLPLVSIFSTAPWRAAPSTSFGTTVLLAIVAASLALASLSLSRGPARLVALAAVLISGSAFASSGHAGTAFPELLTRPMVFVHTAAVAFWIGALPVLLIALGQRKVQALRLFSDSIPHVVLLLVGSGLTLATVQLGIDPSAWRGAYVWVLAAKLSVLALLFSLAAYNRWRLTVPALAGDGRATTVLRRVVRLEIVLVLLVLALVALWRFTPPPRALAQQSSAPVSTHLHSARIMADVTVTPGRRGPVAAGIALSSVDATTLEPQSVTLSLANDSLGIERIEREAEADDSGVWRIEDLTIPVAGEWEIELQIRVGRFELERLKGSLEIK